MRNYFFRSTPKSTSYNFGDMRIGAQVNTAVDGSITTDMPYAVEGAVIYIPAYWSNIEATEGVYDWTYLDDWVDDAAGYDIILGCKSSPAWARTGAHVCEPPDLANYGDYVAFAQAVAARYEPFGMEIWNEPDQNEADIADDDEIFYGCWGNSTAAGQAYGNFYNQVYKAVKSDNSAITLLAGGLFRAYNADFTLGMADTIEGFDAISYHEYPELESEFGDFLTRAGNLRTIFGSGVKLWLTETSLLSDVGGEEFEELKASYVDYVLTHGKGVLSGVLHYTLANNGWRNSDLAFGGVAKPAWYRWAAALA